MLDAAVDWAIACSFHVLDASRIIASRRYSGIRADYWQL
jgi:hypothetical protein